MRLLINEVGQNNNLLKEVICLILKHLMILM